MTGRGAICSLFKGFCVLYRVQRGALREDSQMSESPREPQLNTKVPGSGCFPDFQFSESELGPGICLLDECLSCRPWFRGFRAQDPQLVLGVPACVSITWWPRSPPRGTHNPLPKATGDPQGIPRCSRLSASCHPWWEVSCFWKRRSWWGVCVCVCVCVCMCVSRRQS